MTKNNQETANLLFELGCEEIPARFMHDLLSDLKKKAEEKFKSNNLGFASISTYGTPRRLVLYVEGVPKKQADKNEEIKGPPKNIAFDQSGNLTKAAEGFAKKNGIDQSELVVKDNYIFACISKKGLLTAKILESLLAEIVKALYLPVNMKWGSLDFGFVRPIHWILALYGHKVIKFELAGIKSGNKTYGHRFYKKVLLIGTADINLFKKKLLTAQVILDQIERKEIIRKVVKKASPSALIDENLLNEVTFLVEYPYAVVCSFNPDFLALPKEVLITSMKKNQKYFPIMDKNNKLTSNFVVVTNGCKDTNVREGNERVISARLSDAKFFFDEDKKQPLRMRVPDLAKVQFFEGLGNMEQKTERLKKLSSFIGHELKLSSDDIADAEKVATLCKADLLTQMVFEFPELQGTMGREYARVSGQDIEVSQGIFEHYLPKFSGDALPQTICGMVVSLADKFDTIMGCFGIGKIPSGSADPYGLRRASYGIIRIIIENKMELLLDELFAASLKSYSGVLNNVEFEKVFNQIVEFVKVRLKAIMLEENISHDVIDASLVNITDILFTYDIAHALNKLKKEAWFLGLVQTHDRISRIAASAAREEVMEQDLIDEEEKSLHQLYLKINWNVEEHINKGEYPKAVKELSDLTAPVELFFEKVLVMHQDERIKANRLALLKSINTLFLKVADFRKIVV